MVVSISCPQIGSVEEIISQCIQFGVDVLTIPTASEADNRSDGEVPYHVAEANRRIDPAARARLCCGARANATSREFLVDNGETRRSHKRDC